MSKIDELVAHDENAFSVRTVFGEPWQSNGVTVIPAASVWGGMGGGEGEGSESTPAGRGSGMGIFARPVGAYRIEGDEVTWVPAFDLSRIVMMGQLLGIVTVLVIRSIMRGRRR